MLEYEIETDKSKNGIILIIENEAENKWFSAIKFGADFFYEKYAKQNSDSFLKIIVKKIDYQPVDSFCSFFLNGISLY